MKHNKWIPMLPVLATLVVVFPLSTSAEVVSESYQLRGPWAQAGGWSGHECGSISASVAGGEQVTHATGAPPVTSGYTFASVSSSNWCTGGWFNGWGWTDGAPRITNLNSATFSIPVTLYTYVCTEDPETGWSCAVIDLGTATLTATLTGTGEISRGISMNHWSAGSYRSLSRTNGESRGAEVSMSLVNSEGVDLLVGSTGWGMLNKVNSGSHSLYRY